MTTVQLNDEFRPIATAHLVEAHEQLRLLGQSVSRVEQALRRLAVMSEQERTLDTQQLDCVQHEMQSLAETVQNIEDPISRLKRLLYQAEEEMRSK